MRRFFVFLSLVIYFSANLQASHFTCTLVLQQEKEARLKRNLNSEAQSAVSSPITPRLVTNTGQLIPQQIAEEGPTDILLEKLPGVFYSLQTNLPQHKQNLKSYTKNEGRGQ
jgi:hypothetical protein